MVAAKTDLAISFTTHAHRLTPQLRDELIGAVHYIRVSLDGIGTTYERIRRRSFAKFLEQLEIVSEMCAFGINYVVNDATVVQLDEAAHLAFGSGATELLLLPEVSDLGLAESTQKTMLDWVSANCGRLRLAISESGVTDEIPIADPFFTEKGTKAYIHVSASGKVSRASYEQDSAISIKAGAGILAAIAECEGESV